MNLTAWAWLILPLGLCRATQMGLHDRIFEKPRGWLLSKLNPEGRSMNDPQRSYLSYLLECPWCLSVWISALFVALVCWETTRFAALAVLLILALSLAAVVLDRAVDRWFPDEPHTRASIEQGGLSVEGPPGHVAEAFDRLSGDASSEAT